MLKLGPEAKQTICSGFAHAGWGLRYSNLGGDGRDCKHLV